MELPEKADQRAALRWRGQGIRPVLRKPARGLRFVQPGHGRPKRPDRLGGVEIMPGSRGASGAGSAADRFRRIRGATAVTGGHAILS
ncbi:hypothetical protein NCCP691_11440 [Noviherbaspirillum aridicola]|uniref:Uncharacterized protein n=1 Tax=Noviherbaspirillum aridicola TaxID=2849687 RepID=A0ABQ4Q2U9_9BURK|nr:hypothetical protein NCCP691_11440 [Noviherbaspirillum aridicola]